MATDRLFCPECGTPNEGDALFCESCGHSLQETGEAPADVATPVPQSERRLSPKLIGVLALLLAAGAGAFTFRDKITSLIGSGGDETATQADSVQLVTGPEADPQLKDTAVDPSLESGMPPEVMKAMRDQAANLQTRTAQRPDPQPAPVRSGPARQPDVQPSASLPGMPTPFPEAIVPPPAAATSPTSTGASVNRSDGPPGLPPGAAVTKTGGESAPAPTSGRIAAGSVLSLKSVDQVCTDKTREGARFRAVVQEDVAGSNGATVPKGTSVTFVVDRLKRATAPNEKPEFSIAAQSIELNGAQSPLTATIDAVTIKPKKVGLMGALVGAAAAAAVTRAAGGDAKQTVAGGVAGGAAGAVIGNQLKTGDACIERNAVIRITLAADLTMRAM